MFNNYFKINVKLCLFLLYIFLCCETPKIPGPPVEKQHTIKLYTSGQQYGVADLDHLWLSPNKSKTNSIEIRCEIPNGFDIGHMAWRSNAINEQVWDQLGCSSNDPYLSISGSVWYNISSVSGKQYLKIRYSKDSPSITNIEILIDNVKQIEFIPKDLEEWNQFTETDWIELSF